MKKNKDIVVIEKELAGYDGIDRIVSCYEIKQELENSPAPEWSLQSGLPTIDIEIGGFLGGEVTTISGISGHGKTLLSQTITKNFYLTGNSCVWFSYEVRPTLFLKQFGNPLPDFYMPKQLKDKSIDWIYQRVYEAKLKYDIKAVFVDHLHYLLDMNNQHNVSLTIGNIMRHIVNMAHEFNIHFFLMAHMMKTKPDKEPSLGDVRDSGMVEQESDNVFYIWRDEKNPHIGNLKIAKNRRNGVFNKKIALIKDGFFFREAYYEELV